MNRLQERMTAAQSALRRAQTAAEPARQAEAAASPAAQKAGAHAAEGIDYDRLAAAIASALNGTAVQMDGHAVGVLVTGTVSKEIAREAKRRG